MKYVTKNQIIIYVVAFIGVLGGDLFTKYLVDAKMQINQSQTMISNFFYFTYVHNEGAAWSLMSGSVWVFVIVALLASIALIYFFINSKKYQILARFGSVLVMAGLLGNLFDRLFLGYVRDFIDFVVLGYNFPVFNIADIGVVVGVIIIMIEVLFEDKINEKLSTKSDN